jgi:hypothetical protein
MAKKLIVNDLQVLKLQNVCVCTSSSDRGKGYVLKIYSEREIFCFVMTCYHLTFVRFGVVDKATVNDHLLIGEQKS